VQTRSSKPSMTADCSGTMSQETGRWRRWGWKCPGADMLAGYVDGALDNAVRSQIESHLADCAVCRSLVGDVVTMQRLVTHPIPPGLKRRAMASTVANRKVRRWVLIPATAAGIACALITGFLLRGPRNEIGPISRSPVAPMVAKSEPLSAPGQPAPDVVRNSAPSESLPALLSPKNGAVIRPKELVLEWKLVPHARYYEIHVVTSEGEPAWEGESKQIIAWLPPDITLSDGAYFVWISAYLDDDRVQKSAPVRFLVNASR
jgi:hypothetical protein